MPTQVFEQESVEFRWDHGDPGSASGSPVEQHDRWASLCHECGQYLQIHAWFVLAFISMEFLDTATRDSVLVVGKIAEAVLSVSL